MKLRMIAIGMFATGILTVLVCTAIVADANAQRAKMGYNKWPIPITELDCPADTVTYTDDLDLIRKVNGVMAVKDTVYESLEIVPCSEWIDNHPRVDSIIYSSVERAWFIFTPDGRKYQSIENTADTCWQGSSKPVIRHRRRVGVTVTEETVYKASFNNKAQWVRHPDFVIYPGTAVVWFEWEVR